MKQGIGKKIAMMVAGAALLGGSAVLTQAQGNMGPPPTPPTEKEKPADVAPLTLDVTPPPVNAEEDAAVKTFRDSPNTDLAKKEQAGEDFLTKYPQSRYRQEVYLFLVEAYLNTGQAEKMEAVGDKELELNPNDAPTLAVVGSSVARATIPNAPNAQKRWDKADQYCKKALEILPTIVKPAGAQDDQFTLAKNQAAAMAYSGIGVVAFRRGKYAEAITNLEQAVRVDPAPDPVNYYILGMANQRSAHYEDAVAAFTKCAAIPGGLQSSCKTGMDEAKKLATTQMSAPK